MKRFFYENTLRLERIIKNNELYYTNAYHRFFSIVQKKIANRRLQIHWFWSNNYLSFFSTHNYILFKIRVMLQLSAVRQQNVITIVRRSVRADRRGEYV